MFRCKNCGGIPQHFLTLANGKCLYKCHDNLTGLQDFNGKIEPGTHIYYCGIIYDETGRIFDGRIAYKTDGKYRTLMIRNGKVI